MGKLEDWLAKQFLKTKQGQAVKGFAQPIVNNAVTNPGGFVKGQMPASAPTEPPAPAPKKGPVVIQVGGAPLDETVTAPATQTQSKTGTNTETINWIAPIAIGLGAIVILGGLIYALK
jgi:hypothetical protein